MSYPMQVAGLAPPLPLPASFSFNPVETHFSSPAPRSPVIFAPWSETWGSGGRNPDFLPRATTFLVLNALNAVLPELVVLISTTTAFSTTSSGRTALSAVSTKKVVARGRKSGFRPPDPHVSLEHAFVTPLDNLTHLIHHVRLWGTSLHSGAY